MLSLSFERFHRVLCFTFSGLFTSDDLDSIDPTLVRALAGLDHGRGNVRCLFDMTQVEALAVSQARFRERAAKPAIGGLTRVVVAPPWAGGDFGQSYREAQAIWPHTQPIVVSNLNEAFTRLEIGEADFGPIG
jgi:hypothetical protein